jgi:tryptophan-rich sensory protein
MFLKTLAGTGSAVVATALVGGKASQDVRTGWYRRLSKPAIQPPPVVFPIVWTALYADVALSSASTIEAWHGEGEPEKARRFEAALAANLALNASWTWVFFRGHRLGPAIAVAGTLAASSIDLARRAAPVDRRAAAGLGAYAAWCTFATVLSAAVWRRNR